MDHWRLNAAIISDNYPLQRIDGYFDSFGEVHVFTGLGALREYWGAPIKDEDKDRTTFTSQLGAYRYICMPFG